MVDIENNIVSLLKNNWNRSNTSGIRPEIIEITDKKKHRFLSNDHVILVGVASPRWESAGVGGLAKNKFYEANIDIRTRGFSKKSVWISMVDEVERVLDVSLKLPFSTFDILSYDASGTNLSDGGHGFWRMIIPVKLKDLAVSRST